MSLIEFFSEPVWKRVALTLLHFAWQGFAIAILLGAVVAAGRMRSARIRYAAFLAGMFAMAACPVATFFSLGNAADETTFRDSAPPPLADVVPLVDDRVVSFPPDAAAGSTSRTLPTATAEADFSASATPAPPGERFARFIQSYSAWIVILWAGGVFVFSVRLLITFAKLTRLRRSAKPLPAGLVPRIDRLCARLRMRRPRVFVSVHAQMAAAAGFLRPFVLLPASWLTQLSPDMLEAVVAHELAHIRRHDLWINLFQRVLETLFFYHPAVWWVSKQLQAEREMCCDALAVSVTGQPDVYAETLESAARIRQAGVGPRLSIGFGSGDKKMILLNRVRNVLGLEVRTPIAGRSTAGFLALSVLTAICVATIGGSQLIGQAAPPEVPEAPVSTRAANSTVAKGNGPTGSGLIHQLPKDGTRAYFDMVATVERKGPARPPLKGTIAISSVGRETVKGVPCRWIEFSIGMNRATAARSAPAISKLLISEKRLVSGSNPFDHVIKGWSQSGANREAHAVGPRITPQDGPIHALLPGTMKDVKRLKKKAIKTSLGTLACDGLSGHIDFEERGHVNTITFEIYRHPKAPFGVVSYLMQIETKQKGKLLRKAEMRLTLSGVKENVQSELPKSAVVPGLSQNKIVQEFLRLAITGKDAEAKKLVDANSAVGKQIKEFGRLPNFKNLRIARLYLGKNAVMGVTSTFQTNQIQEAVLVIRARRKDGRYVVDDIDLESPAGLKGELLRFVKDYPPVRFIDYAEEGTPGKN